MLAEQLLELAARSGAEAAEVFQSRSLSRPVYFEANRLKQLERADSEGTALRLWKNGCPGLAVAYGPVEAQALVDRALALSQLNDHWLDHTPLQPLWIQRAELRKFDDMIQYYRKDDWPAVQFCDRGIFYFESYKRKV